MKSIAYSDMTKSSLVWQFKDEFNKLQELKKYFLFEFKMTKAQYDREIVRYTGPDLINFYYRMEDKYKKYARVTKSSPKLKS